MSRLLQTPLMLQPTRRRSVLACFLRGMRVGGDRMIPFGEDDDALMIGRKMYVERGSYEPIDGSAMSPTFA